MSVVFDSHPLSSALVRAPSPPTPSNEVFIWTFWPMCHFQRLERSFRHMHMQSGVMPPFSASRKIWSALLLYPNSIYFNVQ